MYKVIGKAYYSVVFKGKEYDKVRYTLEYENTPSYLHMPEGIFTETVVVNDGTFNDDINIGDSVRVFYNRYKKPECLSKI